MVISLHINIIRNMHHVGGQIMKLNYHFFPLYNSVNIKLVVVYRFSSANIIIMRNCHFDVNLPWLNYFMLRQVMKVQIELFKTRQVGS